MSTPLSCYDQSQQSGGFRRCHIKWILGCRIQIPRFGPHEAKHMCLVIARLGAAGLG